MYLVTVDPSYQTVDEDNVRIAHNVGDLDGCVEQVAQHSQNGMVYVFKLVEKYKVKVNVQTVGYIVNDNGEMIPK